MEGYENAPGTALVATNCAVCGRPLLDAVSVEAGIGPVCAERYGAGQVADETARAEANKLVYQIAARQVGIDAAQACARLRELGFVTLAAKITERIADIVIEIEHTPWGDQYVVSAPYSLHGVEAMRAVPGRKWDKERKVNTFPLSSRAQLWDALGKAYNGRIGMGPKGAFVI